MRWLRTACLGGLLVEGLLPQTAAAYNPSDRYVFPIAQLSLGPRFQLQPEDSVGVLFTVEAGAAIGWPQSLSIFHLGGRRSLWLSPVVGFSLSNPLTDSGSNAISALASLGLGLGYGNRELTGSYTPRLVIGGIDGRPAIGLRHGLGAQLLFRIFSIELAHQVVWLSGAPAPMHELQLLFGLNPGFPLFCIATRC